MARTDDTQLSLFGDLDVATPAQRVGPASPSAEVVRLGAALPPQARFGTSSWSFPGWAGLVYDRKTSAKILASDGLAAYAAHPLFRSVSLDRTYYEPISAQKFSDYAHEVPADFRFLVKAHELLTVERFSNRGRYSDRGGQPNELFLDPLYAKARIVEPFMEGLGEKAGPLVFQFPPQGLGRRPDRFADSLHAFLTALPRGPLYAIEVRESGLLGDSYRAALADTGAVHCVSVHPKMPPVFEQASFVGADQPTVVRWMLQGGFRYEEAKARYEPFDRLVDSDEETREQIGDLVVDATINGRDTYVLANNKAEGSAPATIRELAKKVLAALDSSRVEA